MMIEEVKAPENKYPPGWDEPRVKRLLEHYETQSEDEALAKAKAAFENANYSVMVVPTDLVPAVRTLLADHARKNSSEPDSQSSVGDYQP